MDRRELEGIFSMRLVTVMWIGMMSLKPNILKVRGSWIRTGQKRTERQKMFRRMTLDRPTSVSPSAVTNRLLF